MGLLNGDLISPEASISVVVVDDHKIVRQGIINLLELELDIFVVDDCDNGIDAVHSVLEHHPDVVIMDLSMPKCGGIEAIHEIKAQGSASRVLVLTSFTSGELFQSAIQAGAQGFMLKEMSADDLIHAIRSVNKGEVYIHANIEKDFSHHVKSKADKAKLTGREKEVIALIAKGLTNETIANQLFISRKTVKTHVSNILSKLDLNDRTQVAIYALRNELA